VPIVLTAPLTETIDHAGYFIQMSMASLPIWLEGILNRKYPQWRNLEYNADGTARYMPAGVRVLEAARLRRLNGPGFTWPLFMFANALPEALMAKMGKIYVGQRLPIKTRKELLATVRPGMRQYLRPDTGDMPEMPPPDDKPRSRLIALIPQRI